MGEPQEQDNQLISLENDPIYYAGITPEELMETLHNSDQPRATTIFFNNLHLHIIDPMHLQYDDTQFQKDIQEVKKEGEGKYLKNYSSTEEALKKFYYEDEQYLLLSNIYIKMREKGYQRYYYNERKTCLVK